MEPITVEGDVLRAVVLAERALRHAERTAQYRSQLAKAERKQGKLLAQLYAGRATARMREDLARADQEVIHCADLVAQAEEGERLYRRELALYDGGRQ